MQNKPAERPFNRLVLEKNPYLLQHAYNPVDWYPWGSEAFDKAKKKDKPIFLSIGYSTCHWCHVMEQESFGDLEVAGLLNETFICIKVDREERPDIDRTYMRVCQMMIGHGGWPLTIIMTPERRPIFAATYLPQESRFGRMGIKELIPHVKELWETRRDELNRSAEKIISLLKQGVATSSQVEELDNVTLDETYLYLEDHFDERYGGFGRAPKFPSPHRLTFLLRYWKRTGRERALQMVEGTLKAIRLGGIYDHIGLGFHRYSTDRRWLVPHFEKMLYDQALLAVAYVETYQATGKEEYKETAREILIYILRDMTNPVGGFYSAEDADVEGEEGKFYLWTDDAIKELLPKGDAEFVFNVFNIKRDGNFKEESTRRKTGKNILHLTKPLNEMAYSHKILFEELKDRWEHARVKLFATRESRVHPSKDDKILTDWNGLMIVALAKASRVFNEEKYVDTAKRAVTFIFENMRNSKGRLYHRYRDGEAAILVS